MNIVKMIVKIIQEWRNWFDRSKRKPEKSYVTVKIDKRYY